MSEDGYKIRDQSAIYFITFATVEWIDVFSRYVYADIVVDSLQYCQQEKGLVIYAWCLMSNHLHLIVRAEGNNLSDILRDFKKHTSKSILSELESSTTESRKDWMLWLFKSAGEKNKRNSKYQFWRQDNHPIELSTNELKDQRLEYLHRNPVDARIVSDAEDYLYSSARSYVGEKGLIEIARLD